MSLDIEGINTELVDIWIESYILEGIQAAKECKCSGCSSRGRALVTHTHTHTHTHTLAQTPMRTVPSQSLFPGQLQVRSLASDNRSLVWLSSAPWTLPSVYAEVWLCLLLGAWPWVTQIIPLYIRGCTCNVGIISSPMLQGCYEIYIRDHKWNTWGIVHTQNFMPPFNLSRKSACSWQHIHKGQLPQSIRLKKHRFTSPEDELGMEGTTCPEGMILEWLAESDF